MQILQGNQASADHTCQFNCRGEGDGGAVVISGATQANFTSCTFNENSALPGRGGGALLDKASLVLFTNCTFSKNLVSFARSSTGLGGGCAPQDSPIVVLPCSSDMASVVCCKCMTVYLNNQLCPLACRILVRQGAVVTCIRCSFLGNHARNLNGVNAANLPRGWAPLNEEVDLHPRAQFSLTLPANLAKIVQCVCRHLSCMYEFHTWHAIWRSTISDAIILSLHKSMTL